MRRLSIEILADRLTICRFDPNAKPPDLDAIKGFYSVTRTATEISVVSPVGSVTTGCDADGIWRCLKVAGILDFNLTGVITSIANPLAEDGIPIFPISTFETDYFLVRESDLDKAVAALRDRGHYLAEELNRL